MDIEQYIANQDNSRNHFLKTNDGYKQNNLIKRHLTDYLMNYFDWNYWVTFTFGHRPNLDEVEDILYILHRRIDHRLLTHLKHKTSLEKDERSNWILLPEIGSLGLHYHGFINLKLKPNIGNGYSNVYKWLDYAIEQNLNKLQHKCTSLQPHENLSFKLCGRTNRSIDNLKMILYSMKEFNKSGIDRFGYTILSNMDWKPSPIYQYRTPKGIDKVPLRPNKRVENSLVQYFE